MANAEVAPAHQNPRAIRGMSHPLDASRIPWKTYPSDAPSLALGRGFWWAGSVFGDSRPCCEHTAAALDRGPQHSLVPPYALRTRRVGQAAHQVSRWSNRELSTRKPDGQRRGSAGPPESACHSRHVASPRRIAHPLENASFRCAVSCPGTRILVGRARFSVIHAPVVNTPQRHSTVARNIRLSHPTLPALRTRRVGQAAHQESRWSNRELSTRKPDGQRRGSAGPPESACHSRHVASPRRIVHPLENESFRCAVSRPGTRILVGRRSVFGDSRPCCEHTAAALDRGPQTFACPTLRTTHS